jgi:hypothetical protein
MVIVEQAAQIRNLVTFFTLKMNTYSYRLRGVIGLAVVTDILSGVEHPKHS